MKDFTYLMFDGYHYKIGRSIDPKNRLKNFTTGNPRIKLVAYGQGITESELHDDYKKYNINGEWFFLQEYQIQKILIRLKPVFYDKKYMTLADKKDSSIEYYQKLSLEQWERINELRTLTIDWQDAYRKKSNALRKAEIKYKELQREKFSIQSFLKHMFL